MKLGCVKSVGLKKVSNLKLCKDCKHMEAGFWARLKYRTQKRCTRQDVKHTDKVSGIIVKRTILLNCHSQREYSIDLLCDPSVSNPLKYTCGTYCGKEGQFFEARKLK